MSESGESVGPAKLPKDVVQQAKEGVQSAQPISVSIRNPDFHNPDNLPDPIIIDEEKARLPQIQRRQFGNITKIYSLKDGNDYTDYIVYETDAGQKEQVHRKEVLMRAAALLEMIQQETATSEPEEVDKAIYLAIKSFQVAIDNGRNRGKNYNTQWVRKFEREMRRVEKAWRDRPNTMI